MTHKNKMVLLGVAGVALLIATAGASAYIATQLDNEPTRVIKEEKITWNERRNEPQRQQVAQNDCDDANIVGAAIGAVGGGLVGNQIGSGRGQDLATIGGAIGGGYLGKEYIPTRNVLCP